MKRNLSFRNFDLVNLLDYVIIGCLGLILAYSLFSKRLLKVCFVIAVLSWISKHIIKHKKKFYKFIIPGTFLNKAIGFWILACILSVIFSIDFKYSQRVFFERYLPFIVFFFLGAGLAKEDLKYVKILIGVFLLSAFVVGFGSVWGYLTLKPTRLFTSFGRRFLSLHYYYTLVAPLVVILLLFCKDKVLRIIAGFTGLVCVPALVWNFYRGAIVGFLISVTTVSWFKNKKVFISIILLLVICSFFLLPGRYINRMLSTPDISTWGDRIPMWKSAVSMWFDFPVTGVGIRKYRDLMFDYEPAPKSIKRTLSHAHNTYFQILAEEGILGLLAFLYIFYVFLKQAWEKRKIIKNSGEFAIIGGVIAVIIAGLIFSWSGVLFVLLPAHSAILWIIFGLGLGRMNSLK